MQVTVEYARTHVFELLEVAGRGEVVEITQSGVPAFMLMLSDPHQEAQQATEPAPLDLANQIS